MCNHICWFDTDFSNSESFWNSWTINKTSFFCLSYFRRCTTYPLFNVFHEIFWEKKGIVFKKRYILRRLYEVFWRLKIYDNILWATYVTQWGIFYCTTFIQSVTNYIHGVVHSTLYLKLFSLFWLNLI